MIIAAHMIGDFFLQNNWMASKKQDEWFPCLIHCYLYTLSVMLICQWFDWRLILIFITHLIMDRYRLATKWRIFYSGDKELPWVITADNSIHILILYILTLF